MSMSLKKNLPFKILILSGISLFAIIAYVIIRATSTTIAIVPNQAISSGTIVSKDMLKQVPVSATTPKGYITDKSSLVGQKLRINVGEDQMLYINDVMTSWEELIKGEEIPDNYVVTSMRVPSDRAVGGLITAGDYVDVLGVPNSNYANIDYKTMSQYLGDIAKYDSLGGEGENIYWLLSNVKILQTDSTLSSKEGSSISAVTSKDGSDNGGSYYIVAVSYADYEKLRLSEIYLNTWLSLVPSQNKDNGPLFDEMRQKTIKRLADAQNQSKEYLVEKKKTDSKEASNDPKAADSNTTDAKTGQ